MNLVHSQTPIDSLNVTPNTFQKRTCAFYSFSQNDTVSLIVYNSIGQNILNIKAGVILSSGYYQDSILLDSYPDGIYFTHLKLGARKTIVKKITKTAFASVSEIKDNIGLKLYPNPVSCILHIEQEQYFEAGAEIEITNPLGQKILKLSYLKEIDLTNLASGYYTLKIISPKTPSLVSKFIKE